MAKQSQNECEAIEQRSQSKNKLTAERELQSDCRAVAKQITKRSQNNGKAIAK
jgi:hypothetical protein